MIIGTCFDDDSVEAGWIQHDVYYDALRIIRTECRDMTVRAASLLGQEPPSVIKIDGIDHRSLQTAHDLIAATWRFRSQIVQRHLPFADGEADLDQDNKLADRWLLWLKQEVRSWYDAPHLVHQLMTIVEHGNTDTCYAAEDALGKSLLERYADVPWSESHRVQYLMSQ